MKWILAGLSVICAIAAANAEQTVPRNRIAPVFAYADATAEQAASLNAALPRLTMAKISNAQATTVDQAASLLRKEISYAFIQTPRACTEYKGYFWFSRFDTAAPDDKTYNSGFAVKIGTGEIYRWEQEKPQQGGPAYPPQGVGSADP